jgi:hypothetical protein
MSQRGDPVACPSKSRFPSVMMTPQLVDFAAIAQGRLMPLDTLP